MTQTEFINYILRNLDFAPTDDQRNALATFARFLADRSPNAVMVLRGSAGTGKTTIASVMVNALGRLGQKLMLLAPTGRAAKVLSLNSAMPAYTVHRRIYREKSYQGVDGVFNLNDNRYRNMLFVVDEASMVSNYPSGDNAFGSGSLLDDLMKYVYAGDNCRLLLIGDRAQLPPVGESEAPALCADVLAGYGMRVYECDLDEVLRQSADSGILYNATLIRQMMARDEPVSLPRVSLKGFADIMKLPGADLVESLETSYSQMGEDETIVITRSNKRANVYNRGIRNSVLDREEVLCSNDMLMIVRNNYFWTENVSKGEADADAKAPSFLANGDRAQVLRVRNVRELYGFHFADVWLRFPDYDDFELQATIVMDSLTTDAPALSREQMEDLYNKVMEDYADLPTKPQRLAKLRQDIYFNALQVKFAYAVTCHKAQGGQWQHVYVDQGYMTDDMLTPDYIHWLYTAFTRATDKLFLVNWPDAQVAE